jgi:hypothetical protein
MTTLRRLATTALLALGLLTSLAFAPPAAAAPATSAVTAEAADVIIVTVERYLVVNERGEVIGVLTVTTVTVISTSAAT